MWGPTTNTTLAAWNSASLLQSTDYFVRTKSFPHFPLVVDTDVPDRPGKLQSADAPACDARAAPRVRAVTPKCRRVLRQFARRGRVMPGPADVHHNRRPGCRQAMNRVDSASDSRPDLSPPRKPCFQSRARG